MDEIKSGVYMMTIGDKRYIGSSIDIEKRISQHLAAVRSGRAPSALQEAFNRHGEISNTVLEIVPDTEIVWELEVRERKWIEELNPELNHYIPGNPRCSPESMIERALNRLDSTHRFLSERTNTLYKARVLKSAASAIIYLAECAERRHRTIGEAKHTQGGK